MSTNHVRHVITFSNLLSCTAIYKRGANKKKLHIYVMDLADTPYSIHFKNILFYRKPSALLLFFFHVLHNSWKTGVCKIM